MISKKMICIILGGGAGTRLKPLTDKRSKPAVPIGGKYRLIDIPISNCLNSGVKRMYVLTQFNSASLNRHIKNTYHFDLFTEGFVDILAAEQTPGNNMWFQGTADAVRQCIHHLDNHEHEYVLILSGDQLYQMDFNKMFRYTIAQDADITIATIPVNAKDAEGFGIMKVNEMQFIDRFTEKPSADILPEWTSYVAPELKEQGREYLASMGIYIFKRSVLRELLDSNESYIDFGKEIIPDAIMQGKRVASYAFDSYWSDIGSVSSFYEANLALTDEVPDFNLYHWRNLVYTRPRLLAPTKIFGTKISNALIAEGSFINAKSIHRSIIGIRSRIGYDTTIDSAIIMGSNTYQDISLINADVDGTIIGIGKKCRIERAIIDTNCIIGDNVEIVGHPDLESGNFDTYSVVDGIIVVKKGSIIPRGTKIGKV